MFNPKLLFIMTMLSFLGGCANSEVNSIANPINGDSAVCDGTRAARADQAAALAVSPDDAAVRMGARLIVLIDAGCK